MSDSTMDVVIVGGGLAGIATAYYLGKQGVRSTVIERDAVAHAVSPVFVGLDRLEHEPLDRLKAVVRRLEYADNVAVVR